MSLEGGREEEGGRGEGGSEGGRQVKREEKRGRGRGKGRGGRVIGREEKGKIVKVRTYHTCTVYVCMCRTLCMLGGCVRW